MTEYINIGKIVASFRVNGQVVLLHSLGKKTTLKTIKAIFLEEMKDSFLPYFIENAKIKSERETYLKLEGIATKECAKKLTGRAVWVVADDFKKLADTSAPIALIGFTIVDHEISLGEITEVIEQPLQVLCKIMYQNHEALIPLHEKTLIRIDKRKKQVHVNLPEGLLDIYLP